MNQLHDMQETSDLRTPVVLMIIAVLCGAAIGAGTNALNGTISSEYFQMALRWGEKPGLYRGVIAQGIFEGVLFGLFFGLIVTMVIAIVSRIRCPLAFALEHLSWILFAVCLCWALGGLISVGLATLSGEWYRQAFREVPPESGAMLRYAWVGGSIWGEIWGGLVCVIVGSAVFPARWRRRKTAA